MLTKAQAELLDMLAAGAIYGAEQVGNMEAVRHLHELREAAKLEQQVNEHLLKQAKEFLIRIAS